MLFAQWKGIVFGILVFYHCEHRGKAEPGANDSEDILVPEFARCGAGMDLSICFDDTERGRPRLADTTSPLQERKCFQALTDWAKSMSPVHQPDTIFFSLR